MAESQEFEGECMRGNWIMLDEEAIFYVWAGVGGTGLRKEKGEKESAPRAGGAESELRHWGTCEDLCSSRLDRYQIENGDGGWR